MVFIHRPRKNERLNRPSSTRIFRRNVWSPRGIFRLSYDSLLGGLPVVLQPLLLINVTKVVFVLTCIRYQILMFIIAQNVDQLIDLWLWRSGETLVGIIIKKSMKVQHNGWYNYIFSSARIWKIKTIMENKIFYFSILSMDNLRTILLSDFMICVHF